MNDLGAVRELRASVPEPSAAAMAAGRHRLTAAIQARIGPAAAHSGPPVGAAGPQGTRASKTRRTAAAIVAVAAAVGGMAVVTGTGGSHHSSQLPRRAAAARPSRAVLAAKVLQRAAATTARNHAAEPGRGQWFYSKTVDYRFGQTPRITADREWGTFDGRYTAYRQGGQLIVHRNPGVISGAGPTALSRFDVTATPRTAYQALASLPSNPAALLTVISAHVARLSRGQVLAPIEQYAPRSPSQVAFDYLVELMWNASDGEPPAAQASVYLAMARMPGVSVQQGITDAAGQPAIGVSGNGGTDQLLLDPDSYAVIGIRELSTGVSPAYVASKAQMIKAALKGLTGRRLAGMKAELKKNASKMWQRAKAQDALRWPPKGAVVESLAISEVKPVSGPGRR